MSAVSTEYILRIQAHDLIKRLEWKLKTSTSLQRRERYAKRILRAQAMLVAITLAQS